MTLTVESHYAQSSLAAVAKKPAPHSFLQALVTRLSDNRAQFGEGRVLIFCSATDLTRLVLDTGEAAGVLGAKAAGSFFQACLY